MPPHPIISKSVKEGSAAIFTVSLVLHKIKLDLFILLQMKLKNVVTTKQEKLLLEKVTCFGEGNSSSLKIGPSGVYSKCTSYDYGILVV